MALLQDYKVLFEQNTEIKEIFYQGQRIWPSVMSTGPDYTEPFYVENITENTETVRFVKIGTTATPTITVQYSYDKSTWSTLGTISSSALTLSLQPSQKIYVRANTLRWGANGSGRNTILGCSKVGGNLMSLLYGSNFTGQETTFPSGGAYCFRYLFRDSTDNMTLLDASDLLFPATELVTYCYSGMFLRCKSLINGPKFLPLPNTTASYCYSEMFHVCTSVEKVPDLNLAVLPQGCYDRMFRGCEALTSVKCLATNISAYACTNNWFEDVTQAGTFYCKDASMWTRDASGVPSNWTIVEV